MQEQKTDHSQVLNGILHNPHKSVAPFTNVSRLDHFGIKQGAVFGACVLMICTVGDMVLNCILKVNPKP